jgi:hypothetical protein
MLKTSQYTPHIAEVSYTTQYPDWATFGIPSGSYLYVAQAQGGITTSGKPLQSEGFGQCSALILKNRETLESALFHIDDINLNYKQTPIVDTMMQNFVSSLKLDQDEKNKLSVLVSAATRFWNPMSFTDRNYSMSERESLKTRMIELNQDATIMACYVTGDISRDLSFRINEELFRNLGIVINDHIKVKTDQLHWGLTYDPQNSTLLIDARKQNKVLSYRF